MRADVPAPIPAELPPIDETFDVRYSYKGWQQHPLRADFLMGNMEVPDVDETYDVEHDYSGYVTWQVPADVVAPQDFQAIPELPQIDETYDEIHDYAGLTSWQMPADVVQPEDFQALAENTQIDETYTPTYDYLGWQLAPMRADVELPILAIYPVIDDVYDLFYAHDFSGLVGFPLSNRPNVVLQLPSYLVQMQIPMGTDVVLAPTTGKARVILNPSTDVKTNDVLREPL
jgi:hypothetical protein